MSKNKDMPDFISQISNAIELTTSLYAESYKKAVQCGIGNDAAMHCAGLILSHFLTPKKENAPDISTLMARMSPGGQA